MGGNPRGSKWRSVPESERERKATSVRLTEAERAMLDELAPIGGRGAYVGGLIRAAYEGRNKSSAR